MGNNYEEWLPLNLKISVLTNVAHNVFLLWVRMTFFPDTARQDDKRQKLQLTAKEERERRGKRNIENDQTGMETIKAMRNH